MISSCFCKTCTRSGSSAQAGSSRDALSPRGDPGHSERRVWPRWRASARGGAGSASSGSPISCRHPSRTHPLTFSDVTDLPEVSGLWPGGCGGPGEASRGGASAAKDPTRGACLLELTWRLGCGRATQVECGRTRPVLATLTLRNWMTREKRTASPRCRLSRVAGV